MHLLYRLITNLFFGENERCHASISLEPIRFAVIVIRARNHESLAAVFAEATTANVVDNYPVSNLEMASSRADSCDNSRRLMTANCSWYVAFLCTSFMLEIHTAPLYQVVSNHQRNSFISVYYKRLFTCRFHK